LNIKSFALASGLLAVGLINNAQADIIIGTGTTNNCYPFGCTTGWQPVYQQVYSSAAFGTNDILIDELSFHLNPNPVDGGTVPNNATFTISLSTTTAAVMA
jgi:hypothetical protein